MSEDDAEYEWFNPSARRARKIHRRDPTPVRATKTTVVKSPEKTALSSQNLGEITRVKSVMIKTPYYCRDNQSDDEALQIMLDLGLPYLPVLDSTLRVVGVVSMKHLMLRKQQKDPPHPEV